MLMKRLMSELVFQKLDVHWAQDPWVMDDIVASLDQLFHVGNNTCHAVL